MTRRMKAAALGAAAAVAILLAGLAAGGLFVAYTGAFNVAATEEHLSFTRWAFDTTFHNSVEARAADVAAPAYVAGDAPPEALAAGAGAYKAMCQHCHSGPGAERAEWASGMRPRPPHLAEAAAHWKPEEVFWIVKHGVKMTGMPAFGPSHDDAALWNLVAFVKRLPAMSPERYAALGAGDDAGHHAN